MSACMQQASSTCASPLVTVQELLGKTLCRSGYTQTDISTVLPATYRLHTQPSRPGILKEWYMFVSLTHSRVLRAVCRGSTTSQITRGCHTTYWLCLFGLFRDAHGLKPPAPWCQPLQDQFSTAAGCWRGSLSSGGLVQAPCKAAHSLQYMLH